MYKYKVLILYSNKHVILVIIEVKMPTANLGDISVLAEALVAGLSLAQVNGELLEHVLINQTQIMICWD